MKHFEKKRGLGIIVFLFVFAILVAVVMYLWNFILPEIFGIAKISYLQSAGLIVLSRLLFGGFGQLFHRHGFHKCHKMHQGLNCEEAADLHEKLKGMSLGERREFIRKRMAGLDEED
jgi:ABC-type multidrug transport system fused ATPase/permease subunit